MFGRVLDQMRTKICTRQHVMTLHAEEEMDDDGLSIFDVERSTLTGEIAERQQDHATPEWKYLVKGRTFSDDPVVVVAKLSVTGKLAIITVYRV